MNGSRVEQKEDSEVHGDMRRSTYKIKRKKEGELGATLLESAWVSDKPVSAEGIRLTEGQVARCQGNSPHPKSHVTKLYLEPRG
jgi:hypothetical protein